MAYTVPAVAPPPWSRDRRLRIVVGQIEFRQFRAGDSETLHRIRNDESVRSFMADPRPIPLEAHGQWVEQHLQPGAPLFVLLVRMQGQPIGFSLLKMLSADHVEIGAIFRNAQEHPMVPAQTATIMAYLAYDYYRFPWAVTYVRPEHKRSIDLNRGLGGIEVASDKPGMICFRSPRDAVLGSVHYRKLMARIAPKMSISAESA